MRYVPLALLLVLLAAAFLVMRGYELTDSAVVDDLGRENGVSTAAPDLLDHPTAGRVDPSGAQGGATPPGPGVGVPMDGIQGVVTDERDRPLPAARVVLETLDPAELKGATARPGDVLAQTTTDARGAFSLPLGTMQWARVTASAAGHATVGVRVSGPGTQVHLRLPPAGALEVEVRGADDAAVIDAQVEVKGREAVRASTTDEDGLVRFPDVPPGAASVSVWVSDGRRARAGPVGVVAGEKRNLLVVLGGAVRLRGRVIDGETGLGLPGAEVHIAQPGRALPAGTSAADGTFGPVGAGSAGDRVHVAVRADGYAPALVPVVLPATDETAEDTVIVPLTPAGPWDGRVIDAESRAVTGAVVTYTADGVRGRSAPSTTSDEDGRFRLPPPSSPAPGRRVVLTAVSPQGTAALALRPGDAQPNELVLVLRAGAVVTGRVVGADGAPTAGATMRLDPRWSEVADRQRPGPGTSLLLAMNERGRLVLTAATDAAGWWRMAGVPDGAYDLRLLGTRGTSWGSDVVRVAGRDVDVGTLELGGGRVVKGTTTDPRGRALAGVAVALREADGPARGRVRRTISDTEGHWRLEEVPDGRYEAAASAALRRGPPREVVVPVEAPIDLVIDDGARITGRVRLAERPYTSAFTVTLETGGRDQRRVPRTSFRSTEGRFTLDGVPPGSWLVIVDTARGHRGTVAPVDTYGDATFDVTIELSVGGTIQGVLRGAGGEPSGGGRILLTHDETGRRRVLATNAKGRFRGEGLSSGAWRVLARGPGGAATERVVSLADGESASLDIDLGPVGSILATVRDVDGAKRGGALVIARPQRGPAPSWPTVPRTDDQGRVSLSDVPVGPVEVVARTATGEIGRAQVEVGADERTEVTVVVTPSGR